MGHLIQHSFDLIFRHKIVVTLAGFTTMFTIRFTNISSLFAIENTLKLFIIPLVFFIVIFRSVYLGQTGWSKMGQN